MAIKFFPIEICSSSYASIMVNTILALFHYMIIFSVDISAQNATMWSEGVTEFGVFSVGALHHGMRRDLARACKTSSKPGQLIYSSHHIYT